MNKITDSITKVISFEFKETIVNEQEENPNKVHNIKRNGQNWRSIDTYMNLGEERSNKECFRNLLSKCFPQEEMHKLSKIGEAALRKHTILLWVIFTNRWWVCN